VLHGPLRRARARKNAQHAADWYSDELRRRAALPPTRPPIAGWSRTSVHARDLATNVGSVYQVIGMASNALNAGFHGHENWMPMLDRELVQFVASIPGEIVTPDGRSRGLLRDAMVGTLPEEIRLRRSKADGTHVLSSALLEQLPAIEEFLSRESIAASVGLVRPGSRAGDLERAASAARASSDFSEARDMLHLVGLEAWSRSFFTPVDRMTDR
jgi:asparagine synthetase B (glutamine-hydrolysing)